MKQLFLILFIFTCAVAHMVRATGEKKMIRVLSYNIHHGEGLDGKLDLERIARVIKSASPDLVSLQEVDNRTTRSKGVDQAKELARLTGMKYAYGPSMDFDGGKYGNAILTKFILAESTTIPLPGDPRPAGAHFEGLRIGVLTRSEA